MAENNIVLYESGRETIMEMLKEFVILLLQLKSRQGPVQINCIIADVNL